MDTYLIRHGGIASDVVRLVCTRPVAATAARGVALRAIGDNLRMTVAATIDPTSDEALMRAYALGNARAFETLYDRHEKPLWRFVLRSVRDASVADDVAQEIWLAVARSADQYVASAKFRTWLFTMARNRVIDLARTKKQTQSLDEQSEDGESFMSSLAADSRLGPVRQLESKQAAHELIEAIEALPNDQREAFLLQAEADMSVEEIATATNVSFETAKSRLRYARNRLRSLLQVGPDNPPSTGVRA